MLDALVVGAGPAGLACAIEAKKKGLTCLLVDKGCLVNSIYNFPADMVFFSTPDLLGIGGLVFVSPSFRPTRMEVLKYYMAVADHYELDISVYEKVETVEPQPGGWFVVHSAGRSGAKKTRLAKKVVIATGYYDNPNMLGIEGEDLPKVYHYYTEGHPWRSCDVAIIGGKNSAVESALLFCRAGARVTLIHRGDGISDSVKYWVKPDIEKRIEQGQVKTMFNSIVTRIEPDIIHVRDNVTGQIARLKNDAVFALTGYHPDAALLKNCGVTIDQAALAPCHNPETLETNVPGLYVAGSMLAGKNNNRIFIENSREHGKLVFGG